LFWCLHLNSVLIALSLAGLAGVALGTPSTSDSWVESCVTNHDSEVSHSNSLKNEKDKSNKVSPERAVVAIDDHEDDGNQGKDVEDKGINKVSNEETRSSLAAANNTHNREQYTKNAKKKRTKSEESHNTEKNLNQRQEINKSGGPADQTHFCLGRFRKRLVLLGRGRVVIGLLERDVIS